MKIFLQTKGQPAMNLSFFYTLIRFKTTKTKSQTHRWSKDQKQIRVNLLRLVIRCPLKKINTLFPPTILKSLMVRMTRKRELYTPGTLYRRLRRLEAAAAACVIAFGNMEVDNGSEG